MAALGVGVRVAVCGWEVDSRHRNDNRMKSDRYGYPGVVFIIIIF